MSDKKPTVSRLKEIRDFFVENAIRPHADGKYHFDKNFEPIQHDPETCDECYHAQLERDFGREDYTFTHDDGSPSLFDHTKIPCPVCQPGRNEV